MPIEPFFFDSRRLDEVASRHGPSYRAATPFPHVVIDDFLPTDVLDRVLDEFPGPGDIEWKSYKTDKEVKLATRDDAQLGPFTRHVLTQFNTATFVEFLEKLTGIQGLIPDPHFYGGGLHQIESGGYLNVHADFNWHERLLLDRRINVLVYLNKDWPDEYGGHLELWDKDMKNRAAKVLPVFNRCVIFNTTDFALHGHPDPLTCPEGRYRRSMAFYYYSNGRPAEEIAGAHTTLFRPRPGEVWRRDRVKNWVEQLAPPILLTGIRRLKQRLRRG